MSLMLHASMLYSPEHSVVTVPLTQKDRDQALIFAKQHPNPAQAEQIYLNTLAVLATHYYCRMIDVPTELEDSYSWNAIARISADVADLYIPELEGRLECRFVRENEDHCYIPQEVQTDRIGYIAVHLNDTYSEATLLGFVRTVSIDSLPLSFFQPLDRLIDRLSESPSDAISTVTASITSLVDWTAGIFEGLWQPTETFPTSVMPFCSSDRNTSAALQRQIEQFYVSHRSPNSPPTLISEPEAFLAQFIANTQNEESRFQAAELLWQLNPDHPAIQARRSLDLGLYFLGQSLALLVALLPTPDDRASVLFRIYPLQPQYVLPAGLTLSGFDENGDPLFSVQARSQDNYIQFKFMADWGDRFSLRIALGDAELIKNFVV